MFEPWWGKDEETDRWQEMKKWEENGEAIEKENTENFVHANHGGKEYEFYYTK